VTSAEIVPLLRDLYSEHPEHLDREPYELQSLLWSLGYCEDLIPEAEIAVTIEVARTDLDPDAGAA
jgi:hypothetical protein